MKVKFNWGTGIFIFYGLFVVSLLFQLFKSFQYDNDLVVDNYYEKDIHYQEQYDKIENSLSLATPLKIDYQEDGKKVIIAFPTEIGQATGEVLFYRADDKNKDIKVAISNSIQSEFAIPVAEFPKGEWEVSVDWSANGKDFFDKKTIVI